MRSVTRSRPRLSANRAEDQTDRWLREAIAKEAVHQGRLLEEMGKRVIAATGLPQSKLPEDLDPLKLAEDLQPTWTVYEIRSREKGRSDRCEVLKQIADNATHLYAAVRKDADVTLMVRGRIADRGGGRVGVSQYDHFLWTLQDLAQAARLEHDELLAQVSPFNSQSAFQYTVAEFLAGLFVRHFKPRKGASVSRPSDGSNEDREPDSPFIRFAEAALREARVRSPTGGDYKRWSIHDAVIKARRDKKKKPVRSKR